MLEITKAGRARVASLEFAEEIREFAQKSWSNQLPEEVFVRILAARVALALIERDGESGPALSQGEATEFERFIDDHAAEIDAAVGACSDTLLLHDTDGSPIN